MPHTRTGQVLRVGNGRKNGYLFLQLLRRLADAFPHATKLHVVLDNYGIHSSRLVKWVLIAGFHRRLRAVAAEGWLGSEDDRGADARLRPGEAGSPGSRAGDPQGRVHFAHPGRAVREQRLSVPCAIGPWGGRCASLGGYVTVTAATDGSTAAGGRSCHLCLIAPETVCVRPTRVRNKAGRYCCERILDERQR